MLQVCYIDQTQVLHSLCSGQVTGNHSLVATAAVVQCDQAAGPVLMTPVPGLTLSDVMLSSLMWCYCHTVPATLPLCTWDAAWWMSIEWMLTCYLMTHTELQEN